MNKELYTEYYKEFQSLDTNELMDIFESYKSADEPPIELFVAIRNILRQRSQVVPWELIRKTDEVEETHLSTSEKDVFIKIFGFIIIMAAIIGLLN